MRKWVAGLSALAALVASTSAWAQPDVPACIEVEGIARWAAASFNHYVIIRNGCDEAATCVVSTSTNPREFTVRVPAGEQIERLTFRGSPASTFTVDARCTLDD